MSSGTFKWSFWGFLNEDIAGVWKLGKFFLVNGEGLSEFGWLLQRPACRLC